MAAKELGLNVELIRQRLRNKSLKLIKARWQVQYVEGYDDVWSSNEERKNKRREKKIIVTNLTTGEKTEWDNKWIFMEHTGYPYHRVQNAINKTRVILGLRIDYLEE